MGFSKHKPVAPNPISVKDWSIIGADIALGNMAMQNKDNLHMVGMAAYHYTQALEKSLKSIIRANSDKNDKQLASSLATHDFSYLLVQTELCSAGFVQDHKFIADNVQELSAINGVRYGNKAIRKGDVYVLMKEAQKLYQALEHDLIQDTGKNIEQLQLEANVHYRDESLFLSLDDSNSNYHSNARKPFVKRDREGFSSVEK